MSATHETELIIIPFPIMSHFMPTLQLANLLTERNQSLTIKFLVAKFPPDGKISSFIKNSSNPRIDFVELPHDESILQELMKDWNTCMNELIRSQKGPVRDYVVKIIESDRSRKLAAFVIDINCTSMIDVADEFNIPTYVFNIINSSILGLLWHAQKLIDDQNPNLKQYEDTDIEISVSTYVNPVPSRLCPDDIFKEGNYCLDMARRLRTVKGILVNSFLELESHAIKSLSDDESLPSVYLVGPIVQVDREESEENAKKHGEIITWLDEQPDASVIFICFGSGGYFDVHQVKEIAIALENSGQRFLWSLKKPPAKETIAFAGEYENLGDVLPEGFLQRTNGIGKVIGWAPQMTVLSHKAVGGFVSHCGWNSILESIWCGVPMAVWPLYAEHHVNAYQLVKEFGIAVNITMDYRLLRENEIVGSEKIEKALRELMDDTKNHELRVRVKDLKEKSRMAVLEGGSSYNFLEKWLDLVINS